MLATTMSRTTIANSHARQYRDPQKVTGQHIAAADTWPEDAAPDIASAVARALRHLPRIRPSRPDPRLVDRRTGQPPARLLRRLEGGQAAQAGDHVAAAARQDPHRRRLHLLGHRPRPAAAHHLRQLFRRTRRAHELGGAAHLESIAIATSSAASSSACPATSATPR